MVNVKQEELKDYIAIYASVANGAVAHDGLPDGSADAYKMAMRIEITANNIFDHMKKNIQLTN